MTLGPVSAQVPTIRSVLKYFKVTSYITGVFLLLITVLYVLRLTVNAEVWLFGPNGFISLEHFSVNALGDKEGLPTDGIDVTRYSLIVHGWLYVAYLFGDFRLWSLMRWNFGRFLTIAAGGVVPLLSFFTERHFTRVANQELAKFDSVKPANEAKGATN